MINQIIAGMSVALDAEFGGIKIYAERLEQGFCEPCFFIRCINSTSDLSLGMQDGRKRYATTNTFAVQYFPKQRHRAREEANDIALRMRGALEWITADGELYRGTGMNHEVTEDVLTFTVDYNFYVIRDDSEDIPMDEYTLTERVNGEE